METPAGASFFRFMSQIGSPGVMTVVAVAAGLWALSRRRLDLVALWIAAFGGGAIIERVLKSVVHRARPVYAAHELHLVSFSFPSGHATLSTIGVGMGLYTLIAFGRLGDRWARATAITLGALFVLLVGVSRVYIGAHYPSDVLGGFTAGAGWLAVCIALTRIGVIIPVGRDSPFPPAWPHANSRRRRRS